jgi:hypothetical protein
MGDLYFMVAFVTSVSQFPKRSFFLPADAEKSRSLPSVPLFIGPRTVIQNVILPLTAYRNLWLKTCFIKPMKG